MTSTPFTAGEFERRRHAVREAMAERGWAALLVVEPGNVYYLTGFDRVGYFSFTCLLLPYDGRPVLVARAMEEPTVRLQVVDADFRGYDENDPPAEAVSRALDRAGLRSATIGVEKTTAYFPPAVHDSILADTPTTCWVDGSGIVELVSRIKSTAELELMRQAARLSDTAVARAAAAAHPGATEADIASFAYQSLIAGGDYPAFPPLVRTTRKVAYEHVTWSADTVQPGEGLLVELSGCLHRYHAPLTRTVRLGRASPGDQEAERIALDGLDAIRYALRPGAVTGDAYAAWQAVMDRALGRGNYRRHNCGHLVGYGFFPGWFGGAEMVGLTPGGTVEIREGMTIHVFSWVSGPPCPGDYIVSDTVAVGPRHAEFLTSTPRRQETAEPVTDHPEADSTSR